MKGLATLHVIIMTLFIVILLLIFTAMVSANNLKEQQAAIRDLDLVSVTGLQKLFTASLQQSWSTISTQIVFDALEGRFGLNATWSSNSSASTENVNAFLQKSLDLTKIPSNMSVRLREGRVRELTRTIITQPLERIISAGPSGVAGEVNQSIRIDGNRPAQVDSVARFNLTVGINLRAMVLAAAEAVSGAAQISFQQTQPSTKIAFNEGLRQNNILTALNSRLLSSLSSARGISSASYMPIEILEGSSSEIFLSLANTVRIFDGRTEAHSGRIDCSKLDDSDEKQRRANLYNRYAGAIEKANPDRLLPYVESPRALIAAAIDSFSGWNPNHNKGATIVSGDPVGLLARSAGTGEDSFDPQDNIATGVTKLESALSRAYSFGMAKEELLESGFSQFISNQTEAALAQNGTWPSAKALLPSYITNQASSVRAKYEEWKKCSFGASAAATAKYVLASPVSFALHSLHYTLEDPTFGNVTYPPNIASFYGDPAGTGTAPADKFNHAIEIKIAPDAEIKSSEDGTAVAAIIFGQFGFTTGVAIAHRDRNSKLFYTAYGGIIPAVSAGNAIKTGDVVGTVNASGVLRFGVFDEQRRSVNPCIYLGCTPQAPQSAVPGTTLPETGFEIYNALDYASFASIKASKDIRPGEGFCSLWNRNERGGRSLAYRFYPADGEPFRVWPAYEGTVVRIEVSEEGCGQTVYVKTGDFITAYGRLGLPSITVGTSVSPSGTPIGQIAGKQECPSPHLRVSFAPAQFTVNPGPRLSENACGTVSSGCDQGSSVKFSCDNEKGTCRQEGAQGDLILRAASHICSALEWESVVVQAPVKSFWRERPGRQTFEMAGPELNFGLENSLQTLDCSNPANEGKRFDLVDEKELLCLGGKAYTCGADIKSVQSVAVNANVSAYKCISADFSDIGLPNFLPVIGQRYYRNAEVSRFCTDEDENSDWFCCRHLLETPRDFNCKPEGTGWNLDVFRETGKLQCIDFKPNLPKCGG